MWAASDTDGGWTLWATDPLPSPMNSGGHEWFVPGADFLEPDGMEAMLPDLKPGEKCRVELRRIEETDHAD